MDKKSLSDYSNAQRDRLASIDLYLRFIGEIRRQDLIERFNIQAAAATRDLALYRDHAPQNLEYDTKSKVYRYSEHFSPLFDIAPERVLTWLARGYGDGAPSNFHPTVPSASFPPIHKVDLNHIAAVTRAIHQKKVISVSYISPTTGQSNRKFVPFALVDNGINWSVRGYDRKTEDFLDLALARIVAAEIIDDVIHDKEKTSEDDQWNRIVPLELTPHPVNVPYPDAIETDYGMIDGILKMRVRASIVGYLLRLLNVDCSKNHSMKGLEFPLWLRNRETLYGVVNANLAPGYGFEVEHFSET